MSSDRPLGPPQLPLGWLVAMLPRLPLKASAPSPLEVRSWLVSWKRVPAVPGSPARTGATPRAAVTRAASAAAARTRAERVSAENRGARQRPPQPPCGYWASMRAIRSLGEESGQLIRDRNAEVKQLVDDVWADAGGVKDALDPAGRVEAPHLVNEDVLHGDRLTLHARDLGDVGDLAGAVLHA